MTVCYVSFSELPRPSDVLSLLNASYVKSYTLHRQMSELERRNTDLNVFSTSKLAGPPPPHILYITPERRHLTRQNTASHFNLPC